MERRKIHQFRDHSMRKSNARRRASRMLKKSRQALAPRHQDSATQSDWAGLEPLEPRLLLAADLQVGFNFAEIFVRPSTEWDAGGTMNWFGPALKGEIDYIAQNYGDVESGDDVVSAIVWSEDNIYGNADDYIIKYFTIDTVAATDGPDPTEDQGTVEFTIPPDAALDTSYYIFVVLDVFDSVNENDDSNNASSAVEIFVQAATDDYFGAGFDVTAVDPVGGTVAKRPEAARAGDQVKIDFTVRQVIGANTSPVTVEFYLSNNMRRFQTEDGWLDSPTHDLLLGTTNIVSGQTGDWQTDRSILLTLPDRNHAIYADDNSEYRFSMRIIHPGDGTDQWVTSDGYTGNNVNLFNQLDTSERNAAGNPLLGPASLVTVDMPYGQGWDSDLLYIYEIPDFFVDDLVIDKATATPGETVQVSGNLLNDGITHPDPDEVSPYSISVKFYMSRDGVFLDTEDYFLGEINIETIGDFESLPFESGNLVLPMATHEFWQGIEDGTYYIGTVIDYPSVIPENLDYNNANEGIGEDYAAIGITGTAAPVAIDADLAGESFLIVQEEAEPGDTLDIEFAIANSGADATDDFTVSFFLSTDSTFTKNDFLLDRYDIASLAGGASTGTLSTTLTLPGLDRYIWQAGSGTFYVGMIIDSGNTVTESNETNNRNTAPLTDFDSVPVSFTPGEPPVSQRPDLIVTSVGVPVSTVEHAHLDIDLDYLAPSFTADLEFTIANTGVLDAGDFVAAIVWSTDDIIGNADDRVLKFVDVEGIAAGESDDFTEEIIMMPDGELGVDYWIGVIADYAIDSDNDPDGFVTESTEDNNGTAGAPIQLVTGHGIDLFGAGFQVEGVEPVGEDQGYDVDGIRAGDEIRINYVVRQSGFANTNPFEIRFYLSTIDRQIEDDDIINPDGDDTILLGTAQFESGITGDTTVARSIVLTVPEAGHEFYTEDNNVYRVGMFIAYEDSQGELGEGGDWWLQESYLENNLNLFNDIDTSWRFEDGNSFFGPFPNGVAEGFDSDIIFIYEIPDFYVNNLQLNVTEAAPGEQVRVTASLVNNGFAYSGNIPINVKYYISEDSVFTSSDYLLGQQNISSIGAFTSVGLNSGLVTLPPGGHTLWENGAGTYYIGTVVDYPDRIKENNGFNNANIGLDIDYAALDVTNLPPPPVFSDADLRGLGFNVSQSSAEPGDSINVDFLIQNTGTGDAEDFNVTFYVSRDSNISSSDVAIGTYDFASLGFGQTSGVLSTTLTLPGNLSPAWASSGTYYIGMIVDGSNALLEIVESDNANRGNSIDRDTITIDTTIADPAGDNRNTALNLGTLANGQQVQYTEVVGPQDFADFYKFTITGTAMVSIDLDVVGGDPQMLLVKSNSTVVIARSTNGEGEDESILRNLGKGTYFVKVWNVGETNAGYTVSITADYGSQSAEVPAISDPGEKRRDAHDLGGLSADPIVLEQRVNQNDRDDFYKFTLLEDGQLDFNVNPSRGNLKLTLFQQGVGGPLLSVNKGGSSAESITKYLSAGTYFVRVSIVSGGAPYTLSAAVDYSALPPQQQTSFSSTSSSASLLNNQKDQGPSTSFSTIEHLAPLALEIA